MPTFEESVPTHKQLQLQEFKVNLKQNRINKLGQHNETIEPVSILKTNLRRRVDNSKVIKKALKKDRNVGDYTPSVFESKSKIGNKRLVALRHERLNHSFELKSSDALPTSYYLQMHKV